MSEDLHQKRHGAFYEDASPVTPRKPSMSLAEILSHERGAVHMPRQSEEFHSQAARRLFLAVINQAMADVLENEEEAEAAKRWLSSRDFDSFVAPFGCDAEAFRHRLGRTLSNIPLPETEPTGR